VATDAVIGTVETLAFADRVGAAFILADVGRGRGAPSVDLVERGAVSHLGTSGAGIEDPLFALATEWKQY
jgi:hypothetical protein